MTPMPDTVIDRVNILGKDKQELLVFNDCKGWLIGDGDGDEDKNDSPLKIENGYDINYQEYQEEFNPVK